MRKKNDELKSDQMRRTFTKIAFLLQGLVDRSDVFAPHHVTCSFLKMEGLDDTIRMEYELDTSHLLQDGRPSVKDWMKMFCWNHLCVNGYHPCGALLSQ